MIINSEDWLGVQVITWSIKFRKKLGTPPNPISKNNNKNQKDYETVHDDFWDSKQRINKGLISESWYDMKQKPTIKE